MPDILVAIGARGRRRGATPRAWQCSVESLYSHETELMSAAQWTGPVMVSLLVLLPAMVSNGARTNYGLVPSRSFVKEIIYTGNNILDLDLYEGPETAKIILHFNHIHVIGEDAWRPLATSLRYLDLSDNDLDKIPKAGLKDLQGLQKLYLDRNSIAEMDPEDVGWGGLESTLTVLSLVDNHLSSIPMGGFSSLHSLEELNLSGNRLKEISSLVLPKQLLTINLDKNQRRSRSADFGAIVLDPALGFREAVASRSKNPRRHAIYVREKYVKYFVGEGSVPYPGPTTESSGLVKKGRGRGGDSATHSLAIKRVPVSAIKNMTLIRRISLRQNGISELPCREIPDHLNLEALNLGENQISSIAECTLNGSVIIEHLSLDYNRITQIPRKGFGSLKVNSFNLSFNDIYNVPPKFINGLADNVTHLEFSHNLISSNSIRPALQSMAKSIIALDLSHNDLHNMPQLRPCRHLERLNMESTHLKKIPQDSLNRCRRIKWLNLNYNRIRYIGAITFHKIGSAVETLLLRGNQISIVSDSILSALPNLKHLDLSLNRLTAIFPLSSSSLKYLDIGFSLKLNMFPNISLLENLETYIMDNTNLEAIPDGGFKYSALRKIHLEWGELTEIPDLPYESRVVDIRLDFNMIKSIERNAFQRSQHLETVSLIGNRIVTIATYAFDQLPQLRVILLRDNFIQFIEHHAFNILPLLQVLDLSGNQIKRITVDIFSGIGRLQGISLDLSRNFLSHMENGPDINNVSIIHAPTINLSRNGLKDFPVDFLSHLHGLIDLDLSFNTMNTIYANASRAITTLQRINLESNSLRLIETNAFRFVTDLQVLQLANNHLTSLPDISTLISLRLLNLSNNAFSSLPQLYPPLELLDLTHNKISTVPEYALRSIALYDNPSTLRYLSLSNLSHNDIALISPTPLSPLLALQRLDLSHNRISIFLDRPWACVPKIILLKLNDNPISHVGIDFFGGLQNLRYLLFHGLELRAFHTNATYPLADVEHYTVDYLEELPDLLGSFKELRSLTVNFPLGSHQLSPKALKMFLSLQIKSLKLQGRGLTTLKSKTLILGSRQARRRSTFELNLEETSVRHPPKQLNFTSFATQFKLVVKNSDVELRKLILISQQSTLPFRGGVHFPGTSMRCSCELGHWALWYRRWFRESVDIMDKSAEEAAKIWETRKENQCAPRRDEFLSEFDERRELIPSIPIISIRLLLRERLCEEDDIPSPEVFIPPSILDDEVSGAPRIYVFQSFLLVLSSVFISHCLVSLTLLKTPAR
ncbi:unnamed protein product [Cyprideis torosa]|uniref:Uncharacterized protein n=1 Tax=Cyprideis torosa TaxID=163714 RepID=A0A7R8WAS4_9CRUS|nr:unnamed protein product [Cyprideis torosa]CAG0891357.1 unnamed protein product [Cyprideis torosa]